MVIQLHNNGEIINMKIMEKLGQWWNNSENDTNEWNELLNKVEVETKAYKRIKKIIDTLINISPDVKEIKMIDRKHNECMSGNYCHLYIEFSLQTQLGTRYLIVENSGISYYDKKPTMEYSFGEIYVSVYGDKLYEISLGENGNINIYPQLNSTAPMTEEEIYNSIVEIENILKSYNYITVSEQHEQNINKFIERMGT